ncbi:carbohydrate sulfotransferase 1-like isoform X2 [Apostichopus japonicus]|uniref:carbohydrate sulfotransferase 1-like isoform X2 n=1 Tax=Stichopus japonicus TaxID=307972 RepID=UPI003AB4B09F
MVIEAAPSRQCPVTSFRCGFLWCISFTLVISFGRFYFSGNVSDDFLPQKKLNYKEPRFTQGKYYNPASYQLYARETTAWNASEVLPTPVYENNNSDTLTTGRGSAPVFKKAIVIVTGKRSGSTFVGDIFNNSPGVFYLYEPLRELMMLFIKRKNPPGINFNEMAFSIINNTLQCQWNNSSMGLILNQSCVKSRILVACDLCRRNLSVQDRLTKLSEACREQDSVAIKLIRLQDIAYLEPLSYYLDLRIIHLVRDPRPTEISRMKTLPNQDLIRRKGKSAKDEVDLCQHMQRNLQYWIKPPEWMVGKYLLVRYEDVAMNPVQKAAEIYNFVGLSLNDNVTKWLIKNTQCNSTIQICNETFGTFRNTSAVINRWRDVMSWRLVKRVQSVCKAPMNLLGYRIVKSENDLRNLSIDTVGPLTKPANQTATYLAIRRRR